MKSAGVALSLHNIAITNIVWCMAYIRESGEGRTVRSSRAMLL